MPYTLSDQLCHDVILAATNLVGVLASSSLTLCAGYAKKPGGEAANTSTSDLATLRSYALSRLPGRETVINRFFALSAVWANGRGMPGPRAQALMTTLHLAIRED
jgi:hypothetical protein